MTGVKEAVQFVRIGVIAYDSRMERARHGSASAQYPNLAAAAIVDGHRSRGHEVFWPWDPGIQVDQLWVSVIFSWSKPEIEQATEYWKQWADEVIIGGTGWELHSALPDWLESPAPGYVERAYPNFNAGIGFTFRGCHVGCAWCVVPRKEGRKEYRVAKIADLRHSTSKHIVLMNNNWLAHREGFLEDADDLRSLGLTVDANQANDITLIDEQNAPVLASLKFRNFSGRSCMRFAFDALEKTKMHPETGKAVRYDMRTVVPEKVRLLKDHGIPVSAMYWYVLVGYNTTMEEDLERFEILRSLGCGGGVFIMRYRDIYGRPDGVNYKGRPQGNWVRHIQRWINGHAWRACSFKDFVPWVREQAAA